MKQYLCIDLKSFYASVECVERGLDPMTTNLVVADPERSEKTICLAVSPSMKALGVRNRCRVFEIPKNIDYIMAEPRMQKYIDYSANIYGIYLRYLSKDDVYPYSIDECFLDVTDYLKIYNMSAKEMALFLMNRITEEIGIRATCGIGTNLYLCKIALDITAKHAEDFIGYLDEELFKKTLWNHTPLTDFWRIGPGIERRLNSLGIHTIGELAWTDPELIYDEFGIDAELMIDHAWGIEPVTIADIRKYKPKSNSLSSGQVLMRNYNFDEGLIIVKEMMDLLCLSLVEKNLVCRNVSLAIGYDNKAQIPYSGGSFTLQHDTNSSNIMRTQIEKLYRKIASRKIGIRRINISCNDTVAPNTRMEQFSLFDEPQQMLQDEKELEIQKTLVSIRKKYGKNAVYKAM
ncbi:MAG: DNA repair protein, partial [Erysipelotrichaceae bacterium]|nr:DNA repair protein [Erysipelotrichaceae bacterium]